MSEISEFNKKVIEACNYYVKGSIFEGSKREVVQYRRVAVKLMFEKGTPIKDISKIFKMGSGTISQYIANNPEENSKYFQFKLNRITRHLKSV